MGKNEKACAFKTSVGGQALLEGIMMKGPDKYALAVRRPDGGIEVEEHPLKSHKWQKAPLVRGVLIFIDSLLTGYKCLMRSAEISMPEEMEAEKPSKFDAFLEKHFGDKAMKAMMGLSAVLGVFLALALFMVLPTFLVGLLGGVVELGFWKNVLEGLVKMAIFLAYMGLVSCIKDIYRVFCYHGAEHKTIACYEAGEELTVENVKKYTRFHPRCGTSFLLLVLIISIVVGGFLPWTSTWLRALLKVLLLPVVMSLAYEVIRFAGRHDNWLTRIISAPGLWLQRLTTHEPDDGMIEVAIAAVKPVLPENKEDGAW
ncbi:MAG: DUF1385 domain-containing protein [Oscillospiraceae bacterium]|nr:DUF1385 domain-containing protein [Oscillospiraceae bacterium]